MANDHHFVVRPASKQLGDDVTLSRFARVRVEGPAPKRGRQPRIPGLRAQFVEEGRSKFHNKGVKQVGDLKQLLTSGHNNLKIGRDVRKGRLKGYWVYVLTLEERATCPSTCKHWEDCYGNNMPFAKRADHTDPEFLPTLAAEIDALVRQRQGKVLIRLHALGDFYSVAYVDFWRQQLEKHPTLHVFGYTARTLADPIGDAIDSLNVDFQHSRCCIRISDGPLAHWCTSSITDESQCPDNAFVCPEQTGKTKACATCGACWSTAKNVAFLAH